ncbi:MAG TPA: hypothetical protein VFF33_03525 [Ignavibacteriaceae bacterium]|nr:hypothetical protein [Ignavibacteriaceae bacterium]
MIKKIIVLLFIVSAFIKADSTYVYPGFYYTNGNYSNNDYSNSYAFYTSFFLNKLAPSLSYEKVIVNNSNWKYDENFFTLGIGFYVDKSFLKFNYGYIYSTYETPSVLNNGGMGYGQGRRKSVNTSVEKNNIFNGDYILYDYFNYGVSYTYQNQSGVLPLNVNQLTLRFERNFNYNFFVSLKPSVSIVSDKRKLYSASLRLHYLIFPDLMLKTGGFIGERTYFFDNDLLVFFNQNETQKYQIWAQIDYYLFNKVTLSLSYQHTNFSDYSINYYIAGIRSWFMF